MPSVQGVSVVCGTDFGRQAMVAGEIAARIAARRGEPLHLVHATELPFASTLVGAGDPGLYGAGAGLAGDDLPAIERRLDEVLALEAAKLSALSGAKIHRRIGPGMADALIADTAIRAGAKLIVAGSLGRGMAGRLLLGSTADAIVRRAVAPVLIVRGRTHELEEWSRGAHTLRVLAGIDIRESVAPIAAAAKIMLKAGTCEIHYAFVRELPSATAFAPLGAPPIALAPPLIEERDARSRLERMVADAGLPATSGRVHLLDGRPSSALLALAETQRFDVVVVGTHGRRGLDRALLGSVALTLLHAATLPVLVAPLYAPGATDQRSR